MSLKNIMSRPGCPLFNKSTYILAANRSIRRKCCDIPAEDRERVDHTQDDNGLTWTRKPEESSTENGPKLWVLGEDPALTAEQKKGEYFSLDDEVKDKLEPLPQAIARRINPNGSSNSRPKDVWRSANAGIDPTTSNLMLKGEDGIDRLIVAESCVGFKDDPRYFILYNDGFGNENYKLDGQRPPALTDDGEQNTHVHVHTLTVHDRNAASGAERTVRAIPVSFTECLPTLSYPAFGEDPVQKRVDMEWEWQDLKNPPQEPADYEYEQVAEFIKDTVLRMAQSTDLAFCDGNDSVSMEDVLKGKEELPDGWRNPNGTVNRDKPALFELTTFGRGLAADRPLRDKLEKQVREGLRSAGVDTMLSIADGAEAHPLLVKRYGTGKTSRVARAELSMKWRPKAMSKTYETDAEDLQRKTTVPPTIKVASFTVIKNPDPVELEPMFIKDDIDLHSNDAVKGYSRSLLLAAVGNFLGKLVETYSNATHNIQLANGELGEIEFGSEDVYAPDHLQMEDSLLCSLYVVTNRENGLEVAKKRLYHHINVVNPEPLDLQPELRSSSVDLYDDGVDVPIPRDTEAGGLGWAVNFPGPGKDDTNFVTSLRHKEARQTYKDELKASGYPAADFQFKIDEQNGTTIVEDGRQTAPTELAKLDLDRMFADGSLILEAGKYTESITRFNWDIINRKTTRTVAKATLYYEIVDSSKPFIATHPDENSVHANADAEFYKKIAEKLRTKLGDSDFDNVDDQAIIREGYDEDDSKRVMWLVEGRAPHPNLVREVLLEVMREGILIRGTFHGPLAEERVLVTVESSNVDKTIQHNYRVTLLADSGRMTSYDDVVVVKEVVCGEPTFVANFGVGNRLPTPVSLDNGKKSEASITNVYENRGETLRVHIKPAISEAGGKALPKFKSGGGRLLFEPDDLYQFFQVTGCDKAPGSGKERRGTLAPGNMLHAKLKDVADKYKSISLSFEKEIMGVEVWKGEIVVRDLEGNIGKKSIVVVQEPQTTWWDVSPKKVDVENVANHQGSHKIFSSSLNTKTAKFGTEELGAERAKIRITGLDEECSGDFPEFQVEGTYGPVSGLDDVSAAAAFVREAGNNAVEVTYTADRTTDPEWIGAGSNPKDSIDGWLADNSELVVEFSVHDDEDPVLASGVLGCLFCTQVKECDAPLGDDDALQKRMNDNVVELNKLSPSNIVRCADSDDLGKDIHSVEFRQSIWSGCNATPRRRYQKNVWQGRFESDATIAGKNSVPEVGFSNANVIATTTEQNAGSLADSLVLYTNKSDLPLNTTGRANLADIDALLKELVPITAGQPGNAYAVMCRLKRSVAAPEGVEIKVKAPWTAFGIDTILPSDAVHTLRGDDIDSFVFVLPDNTSFAPLNVALSTIIEHYDQVAMSWVDGGGVVVELVGGNVGLHTLLQSKKDIEIVRGECPEADANYHELVALLEKKGVSLTQAVLGAVYVEAYALVVTDKAGNSATRTSFAFQYDTTGPVFVDGAAIRDNLIIGKQTDAGTDLQKVLRAETEAEPAYRAHVDAIKAKFDADASAKDRCSGDIDVETAEYRRHNVDDVALRGLYTHNDATTEETFTVLARDNVMVPICQDEKVRDMLIARYVNDCVGNTVSAEQIVPLRDTTGHQGWDKADIEAMGFAGKVTIGTGTVSEIDVLGGAFLVITDQNAVSDGLLTQLNALGDLYSKRIGPADGEKDIVRQPFKYFSGFSQIRLAPIGMAVDNIYEEQDVPLHDTALEVFSYIYRNLELVSGLTIDAVSMAAAITLDEQGVKIYDAISGSAFEPHVDARNYELVWHVDGADKVVVRHASRPLILAGIEKGDLAFNNDKSPVVSFSSVNTVSVAEATDWGLDASTGDVKTKLGSRVTGTQRVNGAPKFLSRKRRTLVGDAARKHVADEKTTYKVSEFLDRTGDDGVVLAGTTTPYQFPAGVKKETQFLEKVVEVDITEYCVCLENGKERVYEAVSIRYDVTGNTWTYPGGTTSGVNLLPVGTEKTINGVKVLDAADRDALRLVKALSDIAPTAGDGEKAKIVNAYYFDSHGSSLNLLGDGAPIAAATVEKIATRYEHDAAVEGNRLVELVYVEWDVLDERGNPLIDSEGVGLTDDDKRQLWALVVKNTDERETIQRKTSAPPFTKSKVSNYRENEGTDATVSFTQDFGEAIDEVVHWAVTAQDEEKGGKVTVSHGPYEASLFYRPTDVKLQADVSGRNPRVVNTVRVTMASMEFSSQVMGKYLDPKFKTYIDTFAAPEIFVVSIFADNEIKTVAWPYTNPADEEQYDLFQKLEGAVDGDIITQGAKAFNYMIKGVKTYSSVEQNVIVLGEGGSAVLANTNNAVLANEAKTILTQGGAGDVNGNTLHNGGGGNAGVNEAITFVLDAIHTRTTPNAIVAFKGSAKQGVYSDSKTYEHADAGVDKNSDVEIVHYQDQLFYFSGKADPVDADANPAAAGDAGDADDAAADPVVPKTSVGVRPIDETGNIAPGWARVEVKPGVVDEPDVVYMIEEYPDYYSLWRNNERLDAIYDKKNNIKSAAKTVVVGPAAKETPHPGNSYEYNEVSNQVLAVKKVGSDAIYKVKIETDKFPKLRSGARMEEILLLSVELTMPDDVYAIGFSGGGADIDKVGYVGGNVATWKEAHKFVYNNAGALVASIASFENNDKWYLVKEVEGDGITRFPVSVRITEGPPDAAMPLPGTMVVGYDDGFQLIAPFSQAPLETDVLFWNPRAGELQSFGPYDADDFTIESGVTLRADWEAFVGDMKLLLSTNVQEQNYGIMKKDDAVGGAPSNLVTIKGKGTAIQTTKTTGTLDGYKVYLDRYYEREGKLELTVRVVANTIPRGIFVGGSGPLQTASDIDPIIKTLRIDAHYSDVSDTNWDKGELGTEKAVVFDGTIDQTWDGRYIPGMDDNDNLYVGVATQQYGIVIQSTLDVTLVTAGGDRMVFQPTLAMRDWLLEGLFGVYGTEGYPANGNIYKVGPFLVEDPSLQIALQDKTKRVELNIVFEIVTKAYGREENRAFSYLHATKSADQGLLTMTGAFDDSKAGEPRFFFDRAEVTNDVIFAGERGEGIPYAAVYVKPDTGNRIVLLMSQHMALYDAETKFNDTVKAIKENTL